MWDIIAKNVWTHGQIYVALSRGGNPDNIFVWAEPEKFDNLTLPKDKKSIKNVVYGGIV